MVTLTADLIYGFSGSLLLPRYDNPKPIPEFHREIWELCCDPSPQVAIAAPRGHSKSTAVTHAYALASVLFRKADFVIIVSDTEAQAIRFLNDIKTELYENDQLRQLFQVQRFIRDKETEIWVEIGHDKHLFCIMAKGAGGGGGAVRGYKWRNKRPKLIICDDIENDEAVSNEDRRAKFREWLFGALIPALADDGQIRIVGTILHFDSLLARLVPAMSGEEAKHTIRKGLKLYSTDPKATWKSAIYRAHPEYNDFSEILWPERFPVERLMTIRQGYINQGFPEGYAQEYLNYPISAENAYFKRTDFVPLEKGDRNLHKLYYVACDLAIAQKDKRSYTSMTVGGVDDRNILFIVDQYRSRIDAKEIADQLFQIQELWNPEWILVEDGAIYKSIEPFFQDEMLRRNIWINIIKKTPIKDPLARARTIQGRMRQGGVRFDTEAVWYSSLEEELLRFDKGSYSDQVDSMAWLGLGLREMHTAPTPDELEQLTKNKELAKLQNHDPLDFTTLNLSNDPNNDNYFFGGDGITGYE